ncbi:uncharacterized protein LOC126784411 [Argentina anserina]|uniref:uncharacterized protein LOC126784411 n=1 Tax=Argentina anserina TaxID=57926 RepID=UPI00217652BE|nr:uncharacterized protein LOC126784411 [Potentilla anserina]
MDSINFYDIKAEKANAVLRYRQLRKIGNLFRLLEVFVVLLLISRLSLQLPNAVMNSSFYFRDISGIMFSPRFVFVIGNIIVIILFAKSGGFSAKDSSSAGSGGDFYDEFVQNSEKNQKIRGDGIEYKVNQSTYDGAIVPAQIHSVMEVKNFTRSQSENLEREVSQKSCRQLRRSGTEKLKKQIKSGEKRLPEPVFPEDGMSNEDFRCKVEAFIARQQKLRLQEEYSVI